MALRLNKMTSVVSKKVGLGKMETDAILRVIGFEIIEILRRDGVFIYDGLGTFYCKIHDSGISVSLKLSPKCQERFFKKEKETDGEIIFE